MSVVPSSHFLIFWSDWSLWWHIFSVPLFVDLQKMKFLSLRSKHVGFGIPLFQIFFEILKENIVTVNILSRKLTFWKRNLANIRSEVWVCFIKSITYELFFSLNICLDSNGVVTSSPNGTKPLSGLIVNGVSLCLLALCLIFIVQFIKSVILFPLLYNTGTTTSLFLQTY